MRQILNDRVLVEQIKIEAKQGIIHVAVSEHSPLNGKVVKIGELVENIKENDVIIYKEADAYPINVSGKELFILREYDIIGII